MHTPPFPNRSRLALPSALIACLVAAAGSIEPADQQSTTAAVGVSARQPAGNPSPARGPAGEGSIPTDFRLPSRPIDGYLGFSATRVYTWREGRTIRLLLDGDARVAVGDVEVDADRAVVWLAPVNGAYHTFAYIINASTPEVDASLGIRASKLPLSGVIVPQGPIRMLADARIDRSPPVKMFGPLLTEAEVALGDAIRGRRPDLSGRGTPRFEPLTPIRPANPRTDIIVPEEFQDRQRRVELPRAAPPPPPEPLPDPVPEGGPAAGEVPAPSRRFRIEPDDKPDDKPAAVPEPEVIRQAPSRSTDDLRQPAQTDPANPNVADPPMIGRQREAQHQRTIPPREPRPARPAPREAEQPGAEDAPRMPAVEADTGAGEGLGTSVPPRSVPPRSAPPRSGEPRRPIFASGGVLYFSGADRVVVEDAGERNAVTLFGGVVVQYEGDAGAIELVAQRAVVFLRPGPLPDVLQGLSVEDVDGVYLEGGVRATDGDYTLRSERIYYDVRANRAIAVNAVFHTYDARRGFPLYMRADVVRQEAADEFQADEARFSNTAFFEPHVSIGARNLTIQSRPRPDGTTRSYVDARGVTVRAGNTPVLPLPRFRGDPERIAIRDIRFTDSNRQGFATETEWDPFALFDIERPDGLDATLDLDFDSDRGVGIGAQAEWNTGKSRGEMTAYLLPDDRGTDVGPTGEDIDLGGKTRSLFVLNNRTQVTPEWAMWTSVGYVSDESLTLDLFRRIGREGEDVTNRALLRRIDDQTMLTLEVQGQSNDFIANEHRLQSPGYAVDKLPEIELHSFAGDAAPILPEGLLTHTWEVGFANMRQRFSEVDARAQGFVTDELAQQAFGINADQSLGSFLRGAGLSESFVSRFDTRQELAVTFNLGPIRVNPFAVGRFTAYDTDFSSFSPGEGDNTRLWGAGGVRLSTSVQRVDNSLRSRTFDLHRIRHIIEPSVTLWHAETTVDAASLPVYDDDVEQLGEGSAIRVALDQTWQTQRGAPGRWRSVDVLKLTGEYVWAADSTERGTPIGRWYDARPELGSLQQYAAGRFVWQTSEIVAVAGEGIYDPVESRTARSSVGVVLRPGRGFDTQIGFRRLGAQDATYLDGSVGYLFGDKYAVRLASQYDFSEEDVRGASATVVRDFPIGQFGVRIGYDNITGETSLGFVLRPLGRGRIDEGVFATGYGGGLFDSVGDRGFGSVGSNGL